MRYLFITGSVLEFSVQHALSGRPFSVLCLLVKDDTRICHSLSAEVGTVSASKQQHFCKAL